MSCKYPLSWLYSISIIDMVVRFLLKVPCKRAEKCETDEIVVKQRWDIMADLMITSEIVSAIKWCVRLWL